MAEAEASDVLAIPRSDGSVRIAETYPPGCAEVFLVCRYRRKEVPRL